MMLLSERHLLRSRVNTMLGCLFLGSWAAACGLLIWNASFGTDPLTDGFASIIAKETAHDF